MDNFPPDGEWVEGRLPWVEGRCIPETRLRYEGTKEEGRWIFESRYPVPSDEDPDDEWEEEEEEEILEPIIDRARNRKCPKCNTVLKGKYCHECGARVRYEYPE